MSPLGDQLKDYLVLRRSLGFKLERPGKLLYQFVGYLDEHHVDVVTTEHALAWAMLPTGAAPWWWAMRLSTIRPFAVYLHTLDPATQVPPPGLIQARSPRATPYLYSDTEITALVQAAATLPCRLAAATHQTLIRLLAVTGMRVGEAIRLDRDDLDTDHDMLTVRDTKFGKSRQLPLHPSATTGINDYLRVRDTLHPRPTTPALLISIAGTRLSYTSTWRTFHRLLDQAGIRARSSSCRPRIHDLRHGFAVATLLDGYRSGADVQALLPRLSTYLGHTDPKHTYWYLSAAPELLTLAADRLDTLEGDHS